MTYRNHNGITIDIVRMGRKWAYIRKSVAGVEYFHGKVPVAVAKTLLDHCSKKWETVTDETPA